ncbi:MULTISPECIES: WXG100 family type VII secretion target [Mycobacterium]|uniref:WXG100 family type VII secretion target n=2 Tax=Mycobacterium TaxID=1763 RepID=A0A1W9ZVA2_MYCAN|nr:MULTISPECIES: hypothetical protein [Mycobacterium]MCV7077590.1 hypothetical protein [Mycobacterium szulgai]MCV7200191.1 hypothetical protein [Mycobacterium angelicum]ORA21712.1 hypothetical protein BST12_11690 [Mycobacterium angelicum]ORW89073.1 hypothetical protein AWC27_13405 [Mycobacterium szulgai]
MADVLYNYPAMHACIGEMSQIHATAIALKMAGIGHRQALAASWTGTTQGSFDDAYNAFLRVNENLEHATQRVIHALTTGTMDMQSTEIQACGNFSGA